MTAAAASLPVISTLEPEHRIYWMPISSLIVIRRWLRTSKVTGSTMWRGLSSTADPSMIRDDARIAEFVDPRRVAVEHHDGRAGMLDHGRAGNAGAAR